MRRLALASLLATLTLSLAVGAAERRVDDGSYSIEEATEPALGATATILLDTLETSFRAAALPVPLAELRARHAGELDVLTAALSATRDHAEREALERRTMALKLSQQREELQWLQADALARGDAAYAARLDEALRDLEPRPLPAAGVPVPRDPATGRALDVRDEGGVR